MKPFYRGYFSSVLAGTLGGATFIVFFFLLNINVFISILVSLLAYIAVIFIFPSTKTNNQDKVYGNLVHENLSKWHEKINEIRSLKNLIENGFAKNDIDTLCATFGDIVEMYRKDPINKKFSISYYLDSIINIIKKYIDLLHVKNKTQNIYELIEKCENVIVTTNDSLVKILQSAYEDNAVDLDAEIAVLEKTLMSDTNSKKFEIAGEDLEDISLTKEMQKNLAQLEDDEDIHKKTRKSEGLY